MSVILPVDPALQRQLVTPEGVDLRVMLGSAGQRAGAFLADVVLILAAMLAMTLLCLLAALATKGESAMMIGALWLVGFFLLRNAWFLGFELGPRGATPGKRMFGLRVAARDGGRLTTDALFARNAMREIEVFLPLSFLVVDAKGIDGVVAVLGVLWTGIFALFPLFNRDRLRVGDLVAGTWVVQRPARRLARELVAASRRDARFAFTVEQLDAYGVAELQVLEGVLRGDERTARRAVAFRIRSKIGWRQGSEETDAAFLDAYYAGLRARLEARLLLGERRRDKHDIGFAFARTQLDAYGEAELAVLEGVLRNPDLAAKSVVAARIRAKIGWSQGADETDGAFLEAYAANLRKRLAARSSPGQPSAA